MDNYFFITSYDDISREIITSLLKSHPDIACETFFSHNLFIQPHFAEQSIDAFICENKKDNKLSGSIGRFFCFELQHKTILEKTKSLHRKVNIMVSPELRIKLLLKSWENTQNLIDLDTLRAQLIDSENNPLSIYNFFYFYDQIRVAANKNPRIDLNNVDHQKFLLALATIVTFDSADLPVPGKSFVLEQLLSNNDACIELLHYINRSQLDINADVRTKLNIHRQQAADQVQSLHSTPFEDWQTNLIQYFLNVRLRTLYYPHIDKPLAFLYKSSGIAVEMKQSYSYSKLISIHLNSNRPAQLNAYFNNIEDTADNPHEIEVMVNIDNGDEIMKSMLQSQIPQRKFTLKFIETPKPKSFCELWRPINKLLEITDPNAYFLLNISDEMLFINKGWDTVLKNYVGFFPDHLFRLRASRNKFRNYFDRWECSFAQDAIPITTKKWIDIGGDWNPCFGPDSFQQLVSYYLSLEGKFSNEHCLRDVPIIDIRFAGDVPSLGIAPEKAWKHMNDHLHAMQICQSYPMQLEARRRAMMIKAHMIAHQHQLVDFTIMDKKDKKHICLINNTNSMVITIINYKVSRLRIFIVNQWRKLAFFTYFGDGRINRPFVIKSFLQYLNLKHYFFRKLYLYTKGYLNSSLKKKLPRFHHCLKQLKNYVTQT